MTSSIGRNYARALFDLAAETVARGRRGGGPARGARMPCSRDREARDFLSNRLIGRATKKNLVRAGLEGKVDERVLDAALPPRRPGPHARSSGRSRRSSSVSAAWRAACAR